MSKLIVVLIFLEGKELMKKGTKDFSQAASSHYKVMTPDEREDLGKRRLQSTKSLSTNRRGEVFSKAYT